MRKVISALVRYLNFILVKFLSYKEDLFCLGDMLPDSVNNKVKGKRLLIPYHKTIKAKL